ncbi:MAG: amino acid adenylation domain-containing protein, partial [bacterium]|nr:amino acid adenylation domain-containing protein [bacterium]
IMAVFHNYQDSKAGALFDSLEMEAIERDNVVSKYDLYLDISEMSDHLKIDFEYCADLYKKETIERIVEHYLNTLRFIARHPGTGTAEIDMLSDEERRRILIEFNRTDAEYPGHMSIHRLFEEQAARTPDNISISSVAADTGNPVQELTYRQLNQACRRLANLLKTKGIGPGHIAGVMMDRSFEMMVGIFAILKAGAGYLPIPIHLPRERRQYMLEDGSAGWLLTLDQTIDVGDLDCRVIIPEITGPDEPAQPVPQGEPIPSTSLAYVIYTSGSTGKPKGVMVEHKSVINRLNWMQRSYPLDETSVILQKTPISFDVSVWELFWWSWQGASLCLLEPGGEKNPDAVIRAIDRHKVTTMHFVPSMLNQFLKYIEDGIDLQGLSSLKQVFASGEALTSKQVELFDQLLYKTNRTRLTNLYGPTEATVDVSYFDCSIDRLPEMIPIGKPIDNIQLYILDKDLRLQAVGMPGELCIAGDGLARGYMNRPRLTADTFVRHPFDAGKKLYKTGDLARWLPDGNIEFLGRIDHQVKIRGFRIELGEIQTLLMKHPDVKEAVVIVKERDEDKFLCAYLVPGDTAAPAESIKISAIREFLAKKLPDYMIPAFFVQIGAIPLTPNGKLDRKSLPEPEGPELDGTHEFVGPQTKTEKQIAKIWSKQLKIKLEKIGTHDNFFQLGGHSLLIPNVFGKLNKAFPSRLEIADLFDYLTINKLARYIDGDTQEKEEEEDDLIVELSID